MCNTQRLFVRNLVKAEGNASSKEATDYLFRCFRYSGFYFTEDNKFIYALYSLFVFLIVVIFLPASFIASYGTINMENLEYDTLLTSVQVAINVVGSSLKVCVMTYYVPHLKTADSTLEKLDGRCVEEEEISFLHKLKRLCSRFVVGFAALYWTYAICTFLAGILAGYPPYSLYLPYINWRNSRWEFIVASMIELVLMVACCLQEAGMDGYGPVYVCILRAHMDILRRRIRKLCSESKSELEDNIEDLKLCIKDHKNIIELYNIVSPVISATLFLQFTLTATILGITLINIMIFAKNFSSILASLFYFVSIIAEIFAICYYSNCLMYESDHLCDDIFHSSWIEQSPQYRQMMVFFMQRTQQNIEFYAAKIFPINLSSFISIAKFSLSLFTLIRKMNLKEKLGG